MRQHGGYWPALVAVLPDLQSIARVTRLSTSAGLFRLDTGKPLRGSDGVHVYVAVRDAPWNTIPAKTADWLLDIGEDRFRVTFRASHRHEDIAFDWAGVIEGS